MFRYGVGVHLDVRVLGFVALEVNLEVALGGEAVAADVAFEGALACNTQRQTVVKKSSSVLGMLRDSPTWQVALPLVGRCHGVKASGQTSVIT